jgi:hypothetical protein
MLKEATIYLGVEIETEETGGKCSYNKIRGTTTNSHSSRYSLNQLLNTESSPKMISID